MAMKEQRIVMYLPMLILILTEVLLMSYGGGGASASEVGSWSSRSAADALTVDPTGSEPVERRKRGNTYKKSSSRGSKARLNGKRANGSISRSLRKKNKLSKFPDNLPDSQLIYKNQAWWQCNSLSNPGDQINIVHNEQKFKRPKFTSKLSSRLRDASPTSSDEDSELLRENIDKLKYNSIRKPASTSDTDPTPVETGPEDQEDNPEPSNNLLVRSGGPETFFTDLVGILANAKPTEGAADAIPSDDTPPAARESTSDTEGTQPPHRSGREEPGPGKGDRVLWIGTAPTVPTTMTPIIKTSIRPYLLLFIEKVNPFNTYEELMKHLQQCLDELATLKSQSGYHSGAPNSYYPSNSGLNDNQSGLLHSMFSMMSPFAPTDQPQHLYPSLLATDAPSAIGSIINALNPFPSEVGNNPPGSRPYSSSSEDYGSSPLRPVVNQPYPYNPGSGRPYAPVTTASSLVGSIMDALNPFKPTQPPTPPPPPVTERPGLWQFAANWLQPFSKKLSTMGIILSPDLQGNLTRLLGSVQNGELRDLTKRMMDNVEAKSDATDAATPQPTVDLLSPLGPVLNKLSQLRSVINELNPPQGRVANQAETRRSASDKKKLGSNQKPAPLVRSASGKQLYCQDLPSDYWTIGNYAYKYHQEYLGWDEAKQACAQETGLLVLPENDDEWRVLNDYIKGKADGKELRYHVGFHRKSPAKTWETVYGDGLPYQVWSDDPVYVDPEGELCGGAYWSDYSDYYNGYIGNSCNEPLSFVCEIRIPPECV